MTATPLTDEDVVSAQAGDGDALRRVYEVLAPAVAGYLRLRGSDDPEGSTQDVFLTVFRRLDRVKGGVTGLRTFTFSVAHARLVDEQRRRARRPRLVELEPQTDAGTSASAEEEALAVISNERVIESLSCLNDDQRAVLMLRIVGQLSLDETAKTVGRSVGAVKQLQRRALLALRDRIHQADGVTP